MWFASIEQALDAEDCRLAQLEHVASQQVRKNLNRMPNTAAMNFGPR